MAYEPNKWAMGLIPLAVLWVIGVATQTSTVEADLTRRAAESLGTSLLAQPGLVVEGRDVGLAGAAFTGVAAQKALEAVQGVDGVRLVNTDAVELIPVASPYVWEARREGGKIQLGGSTPNPAARAATIQAAKSIVGAEVTDGMEYRRGHAAALPGGAAFALGELAYMTSGTASLSDGELTLSGQAADSAGYEQTMSALNHLPPGVTLGKADVVPPLAKPFVFSAEMSGDGLEFKGAAPSIASRDAIVAATAMLFPGVKVDNQIRVASGAPAGDFDALARFALATLTKLESGTVVLTDANLVVSGQARETGAAESISGGEGLPAGFALDAAGLLPAPVHPYTFGVVRNADGVRLTGFAPDAATRKTIEAGAALLAAGKPVMNTMALGGGGPAGVDLAAVAKFAFAELALLVGGEARLTDSEFSLTGVAPDASSADAAQAALGAPPEGLTIGKVAIERPAPPPPSDAAPASPIADLAERAKALAAGPALDVAGCDAGFKDLLNGASVEFDTGKATISAASYDLIVKLAGVALRCQVAAIEISGHTDNQGDDALNLALSKQRAESVVAVLVSAGVPAERLSAVGYGAARPIASNDTEEGRARNRRIEFSVR